VVLSEGQELEQIDDQTAAVYYSEGHVLALTIEAEAAHDAVGVNVPTSLAVSGGALITLTVYHRAGNPLAGGAPFTYPIISGQGWAGGFQTEMVVGPPDESELRAQREREEREAQGAKRRRSCTVPTLKGESRRAAKRQLKRARCRLGTVRVREGSHRARVRVIRQRPKPGVVLLPGSPVNLILR